MQEPVPMEPMPLTESSDADLARAWSRGDERAYELIVARYAPLVFARCCRVLSAVDADDATQAVFLVLARKRTQAAAHPAFAAWLMTVTSHVVYRAQRDRQRRRAHERSVPPSRPVEETDMADLNEHLDACLDRLPSAEREAVVLHHLGGRTLAEVGAQTGAGISTVHDRIRRGLERLRILLAARGVALGSAALATALASQVQAAPAEVLAHLQILSATDPGRDATIPSARARHWSQGNPSLMRRIAIAAAGLILLGGTATYLLTSAEATAAPSPATPPLAPVAAVPPSPAVVPVIAGGQERWAIVRIGDGSRILAGLERQPEYVPLAQGDGTQLAELASLRGAGFAYRIGWTPAGVADPAWPQQRAQDFFGAITCASPAAPLVQRVRAGADGPSPWLGMRADGSGWSYWTLSGPARMTIDDARIDFVPPPALRVDPGIAALAAAVPAPGLVAEFMGMVGNLRVMHGELSWAEDGLRLQFQNMSQADAIRAGMTVPPDTRAAAPILDRRQLDGVPATAIWAAAVATRPGSGTVDPLVTHAMLYFTPERRGDQLLWPPAQQALARWIERTEGTLVAWVEPGMPFPSITLRIGMSQADALAGLTACSAILGADGSALLPLGPVVLSVGWRDGALLLTSNPAGLAAIDLSGGFTGHPEVRRALAVLPQRGITACTILRSAAVVDALAPYLALIAPEVPPQKLLDYRARLAAAEACSLVSAGAVDGRLVVEARGSLVLVGALLPASHADQVARLLRIAN